MPNTFTEADMLAAVHPADRARVRGMSAATRRRMTESFGAAFGSARTESGLPRTSAELQRIVSEAVSSAVAQAAAARPRMAPDEARRALQREASELRRTGVAGSDASAFVMACQEHRTLAEDAGYTDADVAETIRQHLTPTPRTGQLGHASRN